jgi:hypothetical protein
MARRPPVDRHLLPAEGFRQNSETNEAPHSNSGVSLSRNEGISQKMFRSAARIRFLPVNGHDWSDGYPSIAATTFVLHRRFCFIDAEIVICGADGCRASIGLRGAQTIAFKWLQIQPSERYRNSDFFGIGGEALTWTRLNTSSALLDGTESEKAAK